MNLRCVTEAGGTSAELAFRAYPRLWDTLLVLAQYPREQ